MKPSILAVGANPALQKVLKFDTFNAGAINRAQALIMFSSGKGINLARAVKSLNLCSSAVMQFSGGASGNFLLRELSEESIPYFSCQIQSSSRICTTCLDGHGNMTEIIEPAPEITEQEAVDFINLFQKEVKSFSAVGISGTSPRGKLSGAMLYQRLIELIPPETPLLLDCCYNFSHQRVRHQNLCLKLNRSELAELTSTTDMRAGILRLSEIYPAARIGITDGADCAFFYCKNRFWRFEIPRLDTIVNPVGSGDSASGAYLSAILTGADEVEAFKLALGCACANTQSLKCGDFSRDLAYQISNSIKIIKE